MNKNHWTSLALALASVACGSANDPNGTASASSPDNAKIRVVVVPDAGAVPPPVAQSLVQTPIVTSQTDSQLINAWGLAFNPAGAAWVADNGTGLATVYTATGAPSKLTVTIPPPQGGMPPSAPTGAVFSQDNADFLTDKLLFATEDGTIAGWQEGTTAVLRVDNSASGAVYKGIAIASGTVLHAARIFATNFNAGTVDVFDTKYHPVAAAGHFADSAVPSGFAPFNAIVVDGRMVLVSYAKQDDKKHDDLAGAGNGFVNLFDLDGHLITRLISRGVLNSPWGMAIAPHEFGNVADSLIVGNFGDGHINAFQLTGIFDFDKDRDVHAQLVGAIGDTNGTPLAIDGLWSLVFGVDTGGFSEDTLYFTAGPMKEKQGLFGALALP